MQPNAVTTPAPPNGGGPSGAGRRSTRYVDAAGRFRTSRMPVPVDRFGRIASSGWQCAKCVEPLWLPLNTKDKPVCEVHNRHMEPLRIQRPPVLPSRELWDVVERPLRPVWALPAMAAAGVAVDAAPIPAFAVLVAAPALGVAAQRTVRRVMTARAAKGVLGGAEDVERYRILVGELAPMFARPARLVGYGVAAGLGWLSLASAVDAAHPTSTGAAVLTVAALVAWLPAAGAWWRRLRDARNRPVEVVEEVTVEVRDPSADEVAARDAAATWAREVDISGTELDPATWKKIKGGWRAVVRATKRGALSGLGGDNMVTTVRRVAAGFDVPRAAIGWIDEYEGSPNLALLLVQPDSPLKEDVKWQPPGVLPVDEAFLHMGMRIDGSPLRTRLWTPGWGAPSRFIAGTKGSGKALALDTPIPTLNGWSTMGALQVGDQVFDETGAVCNVTFATEVQYGRRCYEVAFSDGTVIVADGDHRWKTTTQLGRWQQDNYRRGKPPAFEMRSLHDVDPVTTEQIAATLKARMGPNTAPATNHAIQVCGPLDYPKRDLPIAPYTLGAWLGDGGQYGATISNPDPEVLDQIRQDGYIVTDHNVPISHGILTAKFAKGDLKPANHKSFHALLRDLGVMRNKHIPEQYLRASIDQRRALLAGLLDTDGMCGKSGQVEIDLCTRQLAYDTWDLILGLGYKANMTTRRVKGRTEATSTCYRIKFVAPDPVFRLSRKGNRQRPVSPRSTSRKRYIVDVRPVESVPVRCIQVDSPSHLYLASKACIPTHNTEGLRLLLLGMLEAQVLGPNGPVRLVAPFLHDPKRGKDYGAFRRQVAGFSTGMEVLHLIVDALVREMDRRYDSLGSDVWFDEYGRAREGETAFDPTVHGPILSLVIDELHEPVKDPELMAKLDPMGRKMRAAGIEIVGASHMSTISDTGSQVFRDMMAGGESWLFRTTSALNASLATGGQLTQDPRGLPRAPGSVLFASGDEDTMQARTAYVPSEDLYNRLYDERGRSRIAPVEWPPETLEAFGPEFVEWMRACQAREPGDPAPPIPRRVAVVEQVRTPTKVDVDCLDLVTATLLASLNPLDMNALTVAAAKAGGSFPTRVIRAALGKLHEAGSLFKTGSGPGTRYELTPQARETLSARAAEAEQVRAAEGDAE